MVVEGAVYIYMFFGAERGGGIKYSALPIIQSNNQYSTVLLD